MSISFTFPVVINIAENIYPGDCFKYDNYPNNAGDIYVDSSSNLYRYIFKFFFAS